MVLDEETLRINTKMEPEEMKHEEYLKCEVVCKKELEECRIRCFNWEERYKKAVERCVELEFEVQKKKSENEALEAKFMALETEKLGIENVLKSLREANEFKEQFVCSDDSNSKVVCGREKETERVVDLTEEEDWEMDKVVQLMIENKCLECEKKRTENDLEVWKEKFKELESWVINLENSLLKSGQLPLAENIKLGLGLPKIGCNEVGGRKEWNGANKSNFGCRTGTSLHHLQNEEEVVDLLGVGSTCLLPGKGLEDQQAAATPYATPYKHASGFKEEKRDVRPESEVEYGRVRRHLAFEEERSPSKKMAPSTPGGARPSSRDFIDICDSDDEPSMAQIQVPTPKNQQSGKVCILTGPALRDTLDCEKEIPSGNRLKSTVYNSSDEDDIDACKVPFSSTPKRKRASNIVTSDTDSDDDNIPICKLKRMHIQESIPVQACSSDMNKCSATATATAFGVDNVTGIVTPSRRRLMTLRQFEGQMERKPSTNLKASETKHHPGIPTTGDIENYESDEVESESEGESLGGFIVNSSDDNDGGDSSESQDVSDGDTDFDEILSKIHRNKDLKLNWGFEADMLAAFGKDIELCMKAVCALYRQQTSEERNSKETLHNNGRGFSKFDALRGTTLAEFLTGGDPQGDLKKSVKELQEYDPKAFGLCRTLATHYSKQLFEIFKNKEDPLFLPS